MDKIVKEVYRILKYSIVFFIPTLSFQNTAAQKFHTTKEWEHYFNTRRSRLDPIEGIWMNLHIVKSYYEDKLYNIDTNKNSGRVAIYRQIDTINNERFVSYKTFDIGEEDQYLQITFRKENNANRYSMILEYQRSKIRVLNTAVISNSRLRFKYEKPREQFKDELYYKDKNGNIVEIIGILNQELMKMKQIYEHNWEKLYPKVEVIK